MAPSWNPRNPSTFPNLKVWGWRRPNLASRCSNVWRYNGSASPEAVVQYGSPRFAGKGYDRNCSEIWQSWNIVDRVPQWTAQLLEIKLNIHCTVGDKNAFGHIDLGAESETSSVLPCLFLFRVSKSLGHCFHWRPGADITTSFQHKSQPSDRNQGQTVTKWGSQIFLLDNTKDETEKDLWALWTPRSDGGVFKNAKKNKHTSLQSPEQYLADQPFFLFVGADVKGKLSFTCQGKLLRYMQAAKSDPSFWSVVRLLYPNPYHHRTSWIQLSNTKRYCIMVPKKRWAKITPGPFPQMEVWCSNKQKPGHV